MGQALAEAFLRDGHPTTVWNRTTAKADRLVAQGARLADSAEDAVAASPLVVVCLSTYEAVHEILDPLGDVLGGRVVVNLTSGTSQAARETAAWAADRHHAYLDGAIMAIPPAIGTTDAVILYSGSPVGVRPARADAAEPRRGHDVPRRRPRPVLAVRRRRAGRDVEHPERLPAGCRPARHGGGRRRDVRPGRAAGDRDRGRVGAPATPSRSTTARTRPSTPPSTRTWPRWSTSCTRARPSASTPNCPRFVKDLTDRAIAAGHGSDGYAAMIEQFRKPSGVGR